MAEKYFLTTDADSWWLRFRLEEGHAEDPTQAVTTEASLGKKPLGDVVKGNFAVDSTVFSVTLRASEATFAWIDNFKAYYDDEEGTVNVPLSRILVRSPVGERIFIRLIAEPSTLIATVELVNTRDDSRDQECGGESTCDAVMCDGDRYLTFRIADGEVEKTYVGPLVMSDGYQTHYYVDFRRAGESPTTWPYRKYAGFDPLTGLADTVISDLLGISDAGDSFVYRVFAVGSPLDHIAEGVLTYQGEDCAAVEDIAEPSTRYDLKANSTTKHLRFRIKNFDPDPSLAIVTSISIGRAPQPLTSGEGTFYFRYRVDGDQVWRNADVFFDSDEGVAEIALSEILANVDSSLEFRLVYYG